MLRKGLIAIFVLSILGNVHTQENPLFQFLSTAYDENGLVDYANIEAHEVEIINNYIRKFDLKNLHKDDINAFYINAYNALVILKVLDNYPNTSVENIPGFFKNKNEIAGASMSLNELEALLLERVRTAKIHFVLNCGAKSCPVVKAVKGDDLSQQIDAITEMNMLLNHIVNSDTTDESVKLSQIFYWYKSDFSNFENGVVAFLEPYLGSEIKKYKINYQDYDWSLNDTQEIQLEEQKRLYPVKLYSKGEVEVKLFNNYYTQSDLDGNGNRIRYSFHSSLVQLLLGTNKNLNYGLDFKVRSVEQLSNGNSPLFHALNFRNNTFESDPNINYSRAGLSHVGLRIKYQPFKNQNNINFLHALYFATMDDLEGNSQYGFTDFGGLQIYNNMFYELVFSPKTNLFIDAGFHVEGLELEIFDEGDIFQISSPVSAIFSYYPNIKTTLYFIAGIGPQYFGNTTNGSGGFNLWRQIGPGFKYFVTDVLEVECSYTHFSAGIENQRAQTINIGIRYKN